ncbi:DUF427 domain-containing protein [Pseudonocardia acaciae]|uniref:DUF427 domain-containing protein n=1 Tax=Pseudonocardia acaciae TaxID=551276 RepID=UPI000687709B|nr:DUF427 domain-containing protein [Pseudonocardia acaciae]
MLVSETGLPNRFYLPDLRSDELTESSTSTVCPYKGTASYAGAGEVADVAWCYRDPLPEAGKIAGYWCFDDAKVDVRVDSRAIPTQLPARDPRPPTWIVDRFGDAVRGWLHPRGASPHE